MVVMGLLLYENNHMVYSLFLYCNALNPMVVSDRGIHVWVVFMPSGIVSDVDHLWSDSI
jgi:hypothetical protein